MHSLKDPRFKSLLLTVAIILLQSCTLSEDPTDTLLRRARNLENMEHFREAEEIYDKLANITCKDGDPLQLAVLMYQARFYLKTKKYSKTILACQKAMKVCEQTYGADASIKASILAILASAYTGLEDYDNAILNYKSIIALAPKSLCSKDMVEIMPLIDLGDIEFKRNNLRSALKLYQAVYARSGAFSKYIMHRLINYRLALCWMALGDNRKALSYFKDSLPFLSTDAAPQGIVNQYTLLASKCSSPGHKVLVPEEYKEWSAGHKEYVDWQYARCQPSSRCVLMDKYTTQDYDFVNAIKQSLEVRKH